MRTVGVAVLLAIGLAAPAQAERPKLQREYLAKYAELVDRHGVDEAGCNLLTDTDRWNRCEGKATRAELQESTATLERMLYVPPPPQPKASPPVDVPAESVPEVGSAGGGAVSASSGGAGGDLASIRACESGGNYSTNTGNGYSGAYQFDDATWQAAGGSTQSAHQASPAEQDRVASNWIASGHRSAWPNC
jgi:hypothetical protein